MQMGATRMMVASEVWVQAVTDAALTEGIVWGIVLSSLFAMVSVYVFTGSVVVMALAAATMVCINTLILGLYHVMGWRLGAIEGVSITVLVGLSVDFSIHFSEAFVRSPLIGRRDRAQYGPRALDVRRDTRPHALHLLHQSYSLAVVYVFVSRYPRTLTLPTHPHA